MLYDTTTDKLISLVNTRLLSLCINNNPYYFTEPYHTLWAIQFYFGFRFAEVAASSAWTFNSPDSIIVPLLKNQAHRKLSLLPSDFNNILSALEAHEFLYYCNPTTNDRLFRSLFHCDLYLSSGKRLTSHLFRHLYIKQLYANIPSIPLTSQTIHETSNTNTSGYVFSVINSSIRL